MVHMDPPWWSHQAGPPSPPGTGSERDGWASGSLDHLEVVQDGHDVLRHEDVAGVDRHGGHGDEEGVWRRQVEETSEGWLTVQDLPWTWSLITI